MTAVVCGGAFWRGEREEQVSAGAFVLCWMATILFRDHTWLGTQWGGLAIDAVFFLILTAVSLRSKKYWPMFAAGFQLLGVVTHIARTVDPGVRAWAYATAGVIWTQLVLVALAVGVVGAWRRSRSAQKAA